MERFDQRGNVLLGYSPQRSFENPSSSTQTPFIDSDVDFHDVFGGPPRRTSIQEMRYGFNGAVDSGNTALTRSSWSGLSEKPVFGGESVNRRRYTSDDFFDDIFRGDENYSSPRRIDQGPFSSTPGSRVLSPAHPLPPKAEPFSTTLRAEFSLPTRLTKAMDFHAFASGNRSPYKCKDGTSNGTSFPSTPNASLSRFSNQAIQGQDELKIDVRQPYRQSPLSHEFSRSSDEPSYMTKSDETDIGGNLKRDSKGIDAPSSSRQFHFSIYKWAGRGLPLLMPLRGGNSSKSKEKGKSERCSSSNGRIQSDSIVSELPTANLRDIDSLSLNSIVSANTESMKKDSEKQDNTSTQNKAEPCRIVEDAVSDMPESKSPNSFQCTVENVPGGAILNDEKEDTKSHSHPEVGLSEKTEKEMSGVTQAARKPEWKPLRSLLNDEIEGQGNDEITRKAQGKENGVKMAKEGHSNFDVSKNVKKYDGKGINSNKAEVSASLQGSPINLGNNLGRSGVKGKVKEFVKIFNQETSSKRKINVYTRSQSFRGKGSTGIYGANNEASASTIGMDKKMHSPNVNKMPDASFMVDENLEESEKQHSHVKITIRKTSDNASGQKDASSFSESLPDGSKVTLPNIEDPFQENFLIKELSQDQDKFRQTGDDYEAVQTLDAKIRKWSNEKKGNIRSLLSTLQYVLWPESGWNPVPLVDIIEGSAVKRAYQKALLCLHPDKLQQKGAASHQKYIAEKVFDILQQIQRSDDQLFMPNDLFRTFWSFNNAYILLVNENHQMRRGIISTLLVRFDCSML